MPKRVAKIDLEYPVGKHVKAGEPVEVEPDHVLLLLTLGRIEPEEGEPGYAARDVTQYQTRELTASKRHYHRKAAT